jgi:hypothetical protein
MARLLSTFLSAAIVAAPSVGAQADEVVELLHNPFTRPELPSLPSAHSSGVDEGRRGESLELRATLIAPEHVMANVNGVILTVGDEVEGFRLVEVGERRAILERDGTRVVVSLGDEE